MFPDLLQSVLSLLRMEKKNNMMVERTLLRLTRLMSSLCTEIYSPTTNSWRTDATLGIPRTYHSSAVLVPDGRVFIAGGGLCGGCSINHLDAEMYSPNYLFNADGSPATRPEITASPTTVGMLLSFSCFFPLDAVYLESVWHRGTRNS